MSTVLYDRMADAGIEPRPSAAGGLEEFKRGLEMLKKRAPLGALMHLRRAVDMDESNPYYLSFLGLALAQSSGRVADAEQFCQRALRMKRHEARFYLNLADVYVQGFRRGDAIEVLTMGLKFTGRNPMILRMLGQLNERRPPVLAFLARDHAINRCLGRVRHRVMKFCARHWRLA